MNKLLRMSGVLLPFLYLTLLLFQKDLGMMGDLGRHLKLGEIVLACWCVPQTNLFSYTHPSFPIVNHEWLTEVIFYLTAHFLGLRGLLILKMVVVMSAFGLVYFVARKHASLFWVTIFALLSVTIFSMRFHVLPELFSYFFMGIFLFMLERYRSTKQHRWLWVLPIIELLWVNMHIYFIIGVGMYVLFVLETWLHRKTIYTTAIVGIAIVLATLVNPGFMKGAVLPFTVFGNYGLSVEENASLFDAVGPSSTNANIAYTLTLQILVAELLIVCVFVSLFVREQRERIFSLGTSLFAAGLGLKFIRSVSVLGVLGLVPIAHTFTALEKHIVKSLDAKTVQGIKLAVFVGTCLIVGIHSKGLFEYQILSFSFVPSSENAVNFINQAHVKGPIFNNYRIGNYLIYGLYPKERVFVDARPEAYPPGFFDEYWRMMDDERFFQQQVQKYQINAVVFNVDDDPVKIRPFLLRLIRSSDWVPVYGDGMVTIFVRNTAMNKDVIAKYKIVPK